jgi:hypothetical protein
MSDDEILVLSFVASNGRVLDGPRLLDLEPVSSNETREAAIETLESNDLSGDSDSCGPL